MIPLKHEKSVSSGGRKGIGMAKREDSASGSVRGRLIIAASFLMVFTCLGFCSSTKGLYLAAITEALGLERGLFALNDSIRFLTTATLNLFFGALISRFGPRKLVAAGFLSLIASMLLYSYAESIGVFYLGGALLGAGLAWTTTTVVGYMVDIWAREKKGTIMGAVLAANGLGGALASQTLSPIIYSAADGFGYRTAYRITAVILFAVGALVVSIYKDGNTSVRVNKRQPKKGFDWPGISLHEAARKPFFYLTLLCVFLTGMALQSVNGISSAHLRDVGFDAGTVAAVLSVHSIVLAACKFLTGICSDRIGLRKTLLICDAAALGMTFLLANANTQTAHFMAMGYGVVSAAALPLETVMLPLITAELFGRKSYAKLLGIIVAVNSFGYAVGAPLSNLFFDLYGTYRGIILAEGGVLLTVSILLQCILSARTKRRVIDAQTGDDCPE